MSVIVNELKKPELVKYSVAAIEISLAQHIDATTLTIKMAAAIRNGSLKVRDPITGMISPVTPNMDDPSPWVARADVNSWLANEGVNYRWDENLPKPRMTQGKALLQGWLNEGVPDNIESVWQHIRQNAGKHGFPIVRASNTSAVVEAIADDETITTSRIEKKNLERTLSRLKKQRKNK